MNNVKVIQETKFKSVYISVRIRQPLEKKSVAGNLILANLLNDVCEKYETKQKVVNHLDALYGASFHIGSNVLGNSQIFVAKAKVVHPKFIDDKVNLIEEMFLLLHHFLCKPLMKNGVFDQKWFDEAKRNVVFTLQRMQDDPSSLCMYEAMQTAGVGQPMGDGIVVDAKEIEQVSVEEVSDLYHQLFNNAKADVIILGDVETKEVETYAQKYLQFSSNQLTISCNYALKNNITDRLQYNYKDITQSYITSIYATKIKNDEKEFSALRVANCIFGQIPSSLLFQEIREKNSLCYSIYSALSPYDGALSISTGVDPCNVQKTLDLIEIQYQRMCDGNFSDELLDTAKKMIVNSLSATYDDPESIIALVYRNLLFEQEEDVNEVVAKINAVSKADVQQVMQKGEFVLSYVVASKED